MSRDFVVCRLYRRLSSRLSACLVVELAPMEATFVLFGGTWARVEMLFLSPLLIVEGMQVHLERIFVAGFGSLGWKARRDALAQLHAARYRTALACQLVLWSCYYICLWFRAHCIALQPIASPRVLWTISLPWHCWMETQESVGSLKYGALLESCSCP